MKDFYRKKGVGTRNLYEKMPVGYCKVIFLQRISGIYQADDLTSVDQVMADWLF